MNKIAALALTLGLALPAGAEKKYKAGGDNAVVAIGKNVVVKAEQTVQDVVVIGGSADVRGKVEGSVVVIGGHADVTGSVDEDLVSIGSALLGPKAVIAGDAVIIGGVLKTDPAAVIKGERTTLSFPEAGMSLGAAGQWMGKGLLWGRPLPHQYPWAWAAALVLLLANLLITLLFPKPVALCESELEARPASALLAGAAGMALIGPAAVMLAVSIVGLIVIPFLLCAALIAAWLGKIAVCGNIGRRLGLSRPLPAVAAGGMALLLLYAVPLLGLAAWGLATAIGFGAALLTMISALRRESGEEKTAASEKEAPPAVSTSVTLPRAGFWLRAAATALDAFLFVVIGGLTGIALLGWLGWALYQIGFWCWKGTTIGGIVVGIQGVRLDGRPMDFSVALVRHLASYFSAAAFFLGFLWAGWDPEKQSWHDKIAGTLVVRLPRGKSLI